MYANICLNFMFYLDFFKLNSFGKFFKNKLQYEVGFSFSPLFRNVFKFVVLENK